jgi:hypothetical protein
MILEIIAVFALAVPTAWELIDDRVADHNKKMDVLTRGLLMMSVSILAWYLTGRHVLAALALTIGIHFLIFDYAVSYLLGVKEWFSYLGTTSWTDRLSWWRKMSAWQRFWLRFIFFSVSLIMYLNL